MATVEEVLQNTSERMQKSVDSLERDLGSVRTGRASATLVENLMVDYYGTHTPLNQLSSITIPEARTIMIQPWDKEALVEIERSILTSDTGLTPNNDGAMIRINIPELTEERRKEMVKMVGSIVEQGHVSARNIRRDSLEMFRSMEKEKEISQDDSRRAQENLQKVTDTFTSKMDVMKSDKEKELMEV
ncbi:MAG: ribosome recycling factor [SAR202 cluster bacterium]|jgi:ribosome recycling factor|nr:MAG: ribosome recycling factor [SAR202 cluster bacterium]